MTEWTHTWSEQNHVSSARCASGSGREVSGGRGWEWAGGRATVSWWSSSLLVKSMRARYTCPSGGGHPGLMHARSPLQDLQEVPDISLRCDIEMKQ